MPNKNNPVFPEGFRSFGALEHTLRTRRTLQVTANNTGNTQLFL